MSTVLLVTSGQFYDAFPTPRLPYSTRAFIDANAAKAEAVRHFISYDEKGAPRLGIILGYRDGRWLAPFSAPFAEVAYNKPQSLERIYDFISELTDTLGGDELRITLPPAFYDPQMLPAVHGVLANFASKVIWDYNYHLPTANADNFAATLSTAARKNYRHASQHPFIFEQTADIARAYAIIETNRRLRGYPLAMTLDQVKQTVKPGPGGVDADFFVMSLDGADVAAAMVYRIDSRIAQVIYWGDDTAHTDCRPMNILPEHLLRHYRQAGVEILDIGPSSSLGVPNPGLCRFKESIGCHLTLKPTFVF